MKTKILSVLITVSVLLTCFASCKDNTPSGSTTETAGPTVPQLSHDPYSSPDFRLFSSAVLAGDGILHYNYAACSLGSGSVSYTATDEYIHDTPRLIGYGGSYGFGSEDPTPDSTSLFMNTTACSFAYRDYPYMLISYKTENVAEVNVVFGESPVDNAASVSVKTEADGKYHCLSVSQTDTLNPLCDNYIRIEFAEGTLDIGYIGFFPSEEARASFSPDSYYSYLGAPKDEVAYYEATDENVGKLLDDMAVLKESILSSPNMDLSEITGTVYYVSNTGSDRKDGKSPETAWKTLNKVNSAELLPGDAVCFERGGEWNGIYLEMKTGVTYTAYGEGAKPVFSLYQDGDKPERWFETETPNVWRYSVTSNIYGNIVFNGGSAWGVRVLVDGNGKSYDMGVVSNGMEYYEADNLISNFDETKLSHNLEWWQNSGNQLFLYFDKGNPADFFDEIKLLPEANHLFRGGNGVKNVTVDNIALKYCAQHGIRFNGGAFDTTIRYCTFEWIGGAGYRYGNAVEAWGTSSNFVIHDCYATNVFDCCYTVQYAENGTDGEKQIVSDVKIYNTIGEYSNDSIEFFLNDEDGSEYHNIDCYNNYTANIGYGWSHQRLNKDGNFSYIADSDNTVIDNFTIRDSVYVYSYTYGWLGYGSTARTMKNNTFVMANNAWYAATSAAVDKFAGGYVHLPFTEETLRYLSHRGLETGSVFYSYDPDSAPSSLPNTVPPQGHDLYGIDRTK